MVLPRCGGWAGVVLGKQHAGGATLLRDSRGRERDQRGSSFAPPRSSRWCATYRRGENSSDYKERLGWRSLRLLERVGRGRGDWKGRQLGEGGRGHSAN